MSGHRPFKELTKGFSDARKARVASACFGVEERDGLDELALGAGSVEQELARELKVGQPAVAKLERRADMYVSNLRRYVEALGGSLEITARFPEGSVNIVIFGQSEEVPSGRKAGRADK